ncbi:MAG TPA: nucleoside hydrolase [Syntrophomonas sp.]|nr:nucleoside hydrolase [Syntrophomonas sp.]
MDKIDMAENKQKVIFDCDNTMGIKDCDVDDGLALLYLLGKDLIELCGITSTYGNSDVDTVYGNTAAMLRELGRTDIPLFKGSARSTREIPIGSKAMADNEAARFLVETVRAYPGQISILATGSLTNLYDAFRQDRNFFANIRQIVLMGGITEPLNINGRVLEELNFSCDPAAAKCVLRNKCVSSITGNNCLKAYFSEEDFRRRLEASSNPAARYIYQKCRDWFRTMMQVFAIDGFHNWDVVAAVYLAEPGFFADHCYGLVSKEKDLTQGLLRLSSPEKADCTVNLPQIKDLESFTAEVYRGWMSARCHIEM